MGLYRTITPWALRGINPQNVNWTQPTVYVPVLGVTDFSYTAEFGLISFIGAGDHLHMLTGPALTPDFYGAQILPYVAIGLSIHPFIHSHTLSETDQPNYY
jgi:hypothetical protein